MSIKMSKKIYLGDGVYANIDDDRQIELAASNGIYASNHIYLNEDNVPSLLEYLKNAGYIKSYETD